jgi:hypothetical protein
MGLTYASAEEPICGKWQLIYMKIGDMKDMPKPLPAMKITQTGTTLQFDYLVGLEGKVFRSFKANMDGSPADMTNDKGQKVGTARLTKDGAVYSLVLQTPSGPPEPGKLTLSQEGKILTIESDAIIPQHGPSPTHIVQQFARPGKVPY